MKGSNLAIIAAVVIGGLYLYNKSGGKGLQSVFDNLSSLLGGTGSTGSGTNTPTTNTGVSSVVASGTPAGVLDKNSIPPSSQPAIIAQVNVLKNIAIAMQTNAVNQQVALSKNFPTQNWTPTLASEAIANSKAATNAYWQTKGF